MAWPPFSKYRVLVCFVFVEEHIPMRTEVVKNPFHASTETGPVEVGLKMPQRPCGLASIALNIGL